MAGVVLGKVQMQPMGDYDPLVTYTFLDCVSDDGDYYCLRIPQTVGSKPSEHPDKWDKVLNADTVVTLKKDDAVDGVISADLVEFPDGGETYSFHCIDFHPDDIDVMIGGNGNTIEADHDSLHYDRNSRLIQMRWDGVTWRLIL